MGEGDRGVPWTPRSPTCPPLPLSVGKPHQSRAQVRNECPIPRGMQATKVSEPHQDCCVCSGKPPYLPWVVCSCERTPPPPGPHKPGSQGCSTGASRGPLRCPPSWVHPGLRRLRELRQPGQRADRHPGHERLPDRHEEAQGAAEAAQRPGTPLLTGPTATQRLRAWPR